MRQWILLGLFWIMSCSDDDVIRGNNDTNNASSNNETTNTSSNTHNVVGVACTSNQDCVPQAPICQGDVAVQHTGDGLCGSETGICNYFFVTERVDCTVTVQSCQEGACVDNACTARVCQTPANRCEGTTAVFYEVQSRCDVMSGECVDHEQRVECAAQGATCVAGSCVGACVGVTCDSPPAPRCMGTVAVTSGNGTCNPDTAMCRYTETMMDCADDSKVCANGQCVPDLCANVTCAQPPDVCDMNRARVYSDVGVCNAADGSCDYSGVETVTDCGVETCIEAACVDTRPDSGELVIVEIMANPEAVDDAAGEWFEVINATTRPLNVDGLVLESTGDTPYAFALGTLELIQPGARYVFGINDDLLTNGGVAVDQVYSGISFDLDDVISLKRGTVVVDTVTLLGTFPATPGASASFGDQYDEVADDNTMAAFWCNATTALGTDFGTPGAANDLCP